MLGITLYIAGLLILSYHQRPAIYYSIYGLIGCLIVSFSVASVPIIIIAWSILAIWLLFFQCRPLRRCTLTPLLFRIYQKTQPKLSATEAEALAAGTVGWDGELFSGNPNWPKLWQQKLTVLSAEERSFLQGPVENLCAQMAPYRFLATENDIPAEIWDTLKEQGFFGLHIAKEYGGLAFSKTAIAVILAKIASCSSVLAAMVSVPNSLGPAELLANYGTEEQKKYYLPRLAKGIEVPCFALTSPEAGSDASAMPDYGIVSKGEWQGKTVIGIKITWNKRYITLAPKATLLGLAFKLYDPDGLLGDIPYIGITSVLIPTAHPGVVTGRRHFIGNGFFINGPTSGKDVFIPLDWIIGGVEQKGQGWRMLTECLSAGRAMALPGVSLGGCYAATLITSAYAYIRKQFKVPIGSFEGIQEKIASMAIASYQIEHMTRLTLSTVDQGEKPSVLSAIVKYYATEAARQITHAAMDVQGGKGICMGPRNYLSDSYQLTPIAITVEGANILTRNMIIFGQGAIRCHRYVSACLAALNHRETKQGLVDFDKAIWGHMMHFISLWPRVLWQSLTGGWLIWPQNHHDWRAIQKITLRSARFAFLTEICFLVYGGKLKFAERVSARMADNFIHLYAASSTLKYAQEKSDLAWTPAMAKTLTAASLSENLYAIDKAAADLISQLPKRHLAKGLSMMCFPWGRKRSGIKDKQKKAIAEALLMNNALTTEIGEKVYMDANANSLLAKLIHTHHEALLCEPLYQHAKEGTITEMEKLRLKALEQAIADIIAVDDFPAHAFLRV